MIDYTLLTLFIPTFLVVSATPGMCMTLALTLGMSIGVKRTLWMMWGELIGVALVAILSVLGVASVMLNYPSAFLALKYLGGAYLGYLGIQSWRSKAHLTLCEDDKAKQMSNSGLAIQGFVTAIANPKGWAFFIALMPPFINPELAMLPQLSVLIAIILITEFSFLLAYATGGRSLKQLLKQGDQLKWLNRISGSLMILIGLWLAIS